MFPYWILFSIFAAGSLQHQRPAPGARQHNPLLWAAGVFVAVMIGLRYEVGGDWLNYQNIFDELRYLDLDDAIGQSDPGYSFLNWLAHDLGFEIWFVNVACAVLFTWGLLQFARNQPNPWLAILVAVPYLIIVVAMGYTRQAAALGLILGGLAALERSSLLRFSIYVLIAAVFHKSAIIVLPVVALSSARNRIAVFGLLVIITVMLYYLFVASTIDTLMTNYLEAQYQSEGAAIRVGMNLVPALLYLIYQKRFALAPAQQKLWRNFALAAFVSQAALVIMPSSTAVDRLALYLIPLQMFVLSRLPDAFQTRSGRNGQLTLVVIVYSAIIQLVWLNYATNAAYWVPYKFYPIFG